MIGWLMNMGGLGASAWGAWLLAKGTPLDKPNYPAGEPAEIEPFPADKWEAAIKELQQRLKDSRKGFRWVLAGIIAQAVSQLFHFGK